MHFIQFLLQISDLFFDGCLPVQLFLIIFLRALCFLGNFGNFHKLIYGLLHTIKALPF